MHFGKAAWLGRVLASLAVVALLGGVEGCTFLLNSSSSQCDNDTDCAPFRATFCNADHVCALNSTYCSTNKECLQRYGDNHHICRKPDDGNNTCIDLFSPECFTNHWSQDEIADDNTVFIGALSFSEVTAVFLGADQSIDLARQEFNALGGLPASKPGGGPRKLGVISCNPASPLPLPETAVTAAKHLANDVGVPAIIGPIIGDQLSAVVTSVGLPSKTLVMGEGQGSVLLNDLLGRSELLYRTGTLDDNDASLRAWLVNNYAEPALRASGKLAAGKPLKVLVLRENGDYGDSGSSLIEQKLTFNGGKSTAQNFADGNYKEINYGNPAAPNFSTTESSAISQSFAFQPNVIIVWGSLQTFDLTKGLEDGWPGGIARPYYLFGASMQQPVFSSYLTGNDDRRARIMAVSFTPPASNVDYQNYVQRFYAYANTSTSNQGTDAALEGATASAYDCAYLTFYALAALGSQPITGPNLGHAMRSVIDENGLKVGPGQTNIATVFGALQNNNHVKYRGVSGPLNFNQAGDVDGYMAAICVSANSSTTASGGFAQAGVFYDPTTKAISGSIACPAETR